MHTRQGRGVSFRGNTESRWQQRVWTNATGVVAGLAATACLYGYDTESTVTRLGADRYPPTTAVTLHYRELAATDACTPLALLEVAGSRFQGTGALLPKLEQEAMSVGANAIFGVTATQTARSQGELLTELLDPDNKPTVYSSHLLTGTAARCRGPARAPPDGALGYRFGQRPADVRAECLAQGHVHFESPDAVTCDGTPAVVGFPAAVSFKFCDGTLCKIDVTGRFDARLGVAWQAEFDRLEARLAHRYGLPSGEKVRVPSRCLGDALLGCLAARQASHEYEWRFPNRTTVWLIATGNSAGPAVRIVYGRAPTALPPPGGRSL